MASEQDGPRVVELKWGESGTALGLKITFQGGTTLSYGSKPPAGAVTLLLEHGDEQDEVVWLDSDWGEPHAVFGYLCRVLNPPELKPSVVRVEVRKDSTR